MAGAINRGGWESYARMVIPADAPEIQQAAAAFYGGAALLLLDDESVWTKERNQRTRTWQRSTRGPGATRVRRDVRSRMVGALSRPAGREEPSNDRQVNRVELRAWLWVIVQRGSDGGEETKQRRDFNDELRGVARNAVNSA